MTIGYPLISLDGRPMIAPFAFLKHSLCSADMIEGLGIDSKAHRLSNIPSMTLHLDLGFPQIVEYKGRQMTAEELELQPEIISQFVWEHR